MREKMLPGLIGLLLPFAAYGSSTRLNGAYERRPSFSGLDGAMSSRPSTRSARQPVVTGDDTLDIAAGAPARELILVDAAVPKKAVLQAAARPGVDLVILQDGADAVAQTVAVLQNYRNLDAVHLVSHAEAGAVILGGRRIDKPGLEAQPRLLAALDQATRAGADLLFYGCDLASEDSGLLELVRRNTHMDVAASSDLTGAAELGGDWDLEIHAGDIETTGAFSDKALKDFSAVLAPHGSKIFEGWDTELYEVDPSKDWDGFTTHINSPDGYDEILSSGVNTTCDDAGDDPGETLGDGLYVSMYNPASRFYIRSNPAGESFGVTGFRIRGPDGGTAYSADDVTVYGYDGSAALVGSKGPVDLGPDSPAGTAIDLTTGVTGSFAAVVRIRIEASNDVAPAGQRDFCLLSVDFAPLDGDGNLTAAGGVSEPVALETGTDTVGEAVDVFDFSISDGGSGDAEPLAVTQMVVHLSGSSSDAERGQITWRLDGADANNIVGSYDDASDTLSFPGLAISVADGGSETYTINAYYNDNTNLVDGHSIVLSIDGDTDLSVNAGGTQMGTTSAITNGTGTTINAVASQLVFTTQPAGSVSGLALATQPVVAARDDAGNIDVDFTETITLTESSAGALNNNTQAASNGVATFSNLAYTATADQQSFTLTADDQGGVNGDLPAADATPVVSDVVASQLIFTTQPAPTSIPNAEPTPFTTVPVVSAVDANGVVDTGHGIDITLAEANGAGTATMSATGDTDGDSSTVSVAPAAGSASFSGMEITYVASGATDEDFNLRASSGSLATVDSIDLTAIVHVPAPILGLEVDDGVEYASYGELLEYMVVVDNSGDGGSTGASMASVYSAGLEGGLANWQCLDGGSPGNPAVAHCTPASGSGALDATVDLPAGTSLSFLVSVPVHSAATAAEVQMDASVHDSAQAITASDNDVDTLVLFRDGFEPAGANLARALANDMQAGELAPMACKDAAGSASGSAPVLRVPSHAGEAWIDRLFVADIQGGDRVAVERLNGTSAPWLRLFLADAEGKQRASGWASSHAGASLMLGLADDGAGRWLLLEGDGVSLRLPLSVGDAGDAGCD